MIQSAYHNGINFSGDFSRTNELINFNAQRRAGYFILNSNVKYLSFSWDKITTPLVCKLYVISSLSTSEFSPSYYEVIGTTTIFYFTIGSDFLDLDVLNYCKLKIDEDVVYSEYFHTKDINFANENHILHLTATNNDNRHGFLTREAFGFFQVTGFNEPFFINEKTEYKYSYSRTKILSSENNVARRITFKNLTNYNQILLKWLCNCENFFIEGVQYELISEFTELLNDENSEIKDLRADFIKSEQSFFGAGALVAPTNVFPTEFFM